MNNQALAARIKDVRINHDKTQEEFAYVLSMSRQAYARIEQGKRGITFVEICKLADFIGEHYSIFTELEEEKDLSLSALCGNQSYNSDQQFVFEKVNDILNVFGAQERLYFRTRDDD